MIVVDLNLLIYAVNRESEKHTRSKAWLEQVLNEDDTVALPWVVLLGFLRITTNPRVFPNPLNSADAIGIVDGWLSQPCVRILHPGEEHWRVMCGLLGETGTAGNLTTDAHLAALAIENGCKLCSTDGDFSRFPRLLWDNPVG